MTRISAIALVAFSALAACDVEPAQPLVTSFNGDSVSISGHQWLKRGDKTNGEAERICSLKGKKAQYASTKTVSSDGQVEHLYLCL